MPSSKNVSPIAIDQWKLDQIRHLYEGGLSIEDISDQVSIDSVAVREAIELIYSGKKEIYGVTVGP